jgi:predicted unusual protein kinase regulating ubiquinone biosynthesis (AarF/ABC1/UbiB family)
MGMVNKPPRSGALSRGIRLGKLGLTLTGSYLGYQAQNILLGENKERRRRFQKESSQLIRNELGSLKGAAMKLGQLLSLQTRHCQKLSRKNLQGCKCRRPDASDFGRAQFKSSLDKYPEEVFRQFEQEPFAAASLGQVHRAMTKHGEKVAVKIQYPAIRASIENDFKLLRSATTPVRLSGHFPQSILDEVQRGFLEETDYLHEADNLEFFSERFADLEFITVPKVFRSLSTERVLTMSFVEGDPVSEFLKQRPSAALRNQIGARLLESYYHQLHRLRAIHADHHPGNYLFRPDGGIGIVDFGCVKKITFDAGELVRGIIARSWREGDEQAQKLLALAFGPDVPYARAKRMLPTLEIMAASWFPEGATADALHDFGKGELLTVLADAMRKSLRDKIVNPDFAFVSRAELGLYSLLHRLDAKINPRAIWERVERGDGSTTAVCPKTKSVS